jgi:tRNA threonylcarbamoyladenosine modification (KEOPS) complex  Pcc1 subunit
MDVKLRLVVSDKTADKMYSALKPDFSKKGRSEVNMSFKGEDLIFDINSKDFTSVRASINSILLKLRALNELK